MTNFIDELKNIGHTVQQLHKVSDAMDNLATLDEWRGNTHESIRSLFASLAECAHITAATLLGDLNDGERVRENLFLSVLAETVATLTGFYSAAVLEEAKATNPQCIESAFGKLNDFHDTYHYSAHVTLCEATGVFPRIESHIQNIEYRANRKYNPKENCRESTIKAEQRAEKLDKENRALRKLIAGGQDAP